MSSFSTLAKQDMLYRYNNPLKKVGRLTYEQNPKYFDEHGFEWTDCITYVANVLRTTFKKLNNQPAVSGVTKNSASGVQLAQYLISNYDWEGVYVNADINHPADGENKHPLAYLQQVKPNAKYYGIPVHHTLLNYRPTDEESAKEQGSWRIYKSRGLKVGPTELNLVDYRTMKQIPFGIGLSNGGDHCWLFSSGKVYEVHWQGIGRDVYESHELNTFPWLSGMIIVPKDSVSLLKNLPKVLAHAHS